MKKITLSVILIVGILYSFNAFSQIDSLNQDSTAFVFDRFGNPSSIQDITKSEEELQKITSCQAGFFNMTFEDDGTGIGFDDPVEGPARRNVLCQVFTDLSELIAPAVNPCDGTLPVVEIQVKPSITDTTTGVLGAASPYYRTCGNSGIIHSEVFKTINGGVNSLINIGGTFHGYIIINFSGTFNWHLDLDTLPPGNKYDLYSLIIHEAIHSLGFASLINFDGTSKLTGTSPGFYSKYDTWLRINGGNFLINNFDSCYNVGFNADSSDIISGCPNIIFDGINAGQQFVYAPPVYSIGSSLSHFDDDCPSVGTNAFVMHFALGSGEMKRVPTPMEVQALCDIGYQTTGIFGDSTLFFHTSTLPSCGSRIAGVNDFGPSCSVNRFIVRDCDTLTITDILNNDENAVQFECLEVISGNGGISTTTGTSFDFFPANPGLVILRYIPVGAGGEKGNITCIFILVTPCQPGCVDPATCNLICNSEILAPNPISNTQSPFESGEIPGWTRAWYNPQYDTTSTPPPPNNGFAMMWAQSSDLQFNFAHLGESVMTFVPIEKDKNYILSFYRKLTPIDTNILNHVFVRLADDTSALNVGIPGIGYSIPNIPVISQLVYHEENLVNLNWEQIVVCFTADDNYDFIYFYPEQNDSVSQAWLWLDQVELIPDTLSAGEDKQVTNCGGFTLIGPPVPNCNVTNTVYTWFILGDTTSISNDEFITVGQGIYILKRTFNADTLVGNCVKYDTIVVSDPLPLVDAGPDTSICIGDSVVIGPLVVDNSLIYNWTPTSGLNDPTIANPTASPIVTTNYILTVTDTITGCTSNDQVSVIVPDTITITLDTIINVTCKGGDDGSIAISVSGGTPPYSFNWSNGANTEVIDSLTGGAYSVIVTDANGCITLDTFTVLEPIVPTSFGPEPVLEALVVFAASTNITCNATTCDGTATAIVTGGTTPYTYQWDDLLGQTDSIAIGLCVGTYTITVTDSNGCTDTASVMIDTTIMTVLLTSNDATCGECDGYASVIHFNGIPPFIYLWDDSLSQTTPIADSLCPGTYNVTVTDVNSCAANGNITINEPFDCDGNVFIHPFGIIDTLSPCGTTQIWTPCPGFDYFYSVVFTNSGCNDTYQPGTILEIQLDTTMSYLSTVTNFCGLIQVNNNPLQWEITDTIQLQPGNSCQITVMVHVNSIPPGGVEYKCIYYSHLR